MPAISLRSAAGRDWKRSLRGRTRMYLWVMKKKDVYCIYVNVGLYFCEMKELGSTLTHARTRSPPFASQQASPQHHSLQQLATRPQPLLPTSRAPPPPPRPPLSPSPRSPSKWWSGEWWGTSFFLFVVFLALSSGRAAFFECELLNNKHNHLEFFVFLLLARATGRKEGCPKQIELKKQNFNRNPVRTLQKKEHNEGKKSRGM